MDINELNAEIGLYKNDSSILEEEKNTVISIFQAEIARQQYDEYINKQKQTLQSIRIEIIRQLVQKYNSFDDDRKTRTINIINNLVGYYALGEEMFKLDDHINTVYTGNVYYDEYVDNNIHNLLIQGQQVGKSFDNTQIRKYFVIGEKLSNIFDEEQFDFIDSETGNYKNQDIIVKNFSDASSKIASLNVESRAKGILRNIMMDVKQTGISYFSNINKAPSLNVDVIFDEISQQGYISDETIQNLDSLIIMSNEYSDSNNIGRKK